jgi:TPR repeat protein
LFLAGSTAVFALDSSPDSKPPPKISPKTFSNPHEALRAGVDDLKAGDAKSSVQALTYAAEGGEALARWKLGSMYASGEVVPRDDVMAYKYFEQLVDGYNEDDLDRSDISAISNAFVEVGVYSLTGIANSEITPDPERALEMFQFAATNFGDPEAQYRLARMYIDGAAGLDKDNMRAARWLQLAADKGHHGAQALLGHLLFTGDGVPSQRARGLMWLWIAKSGAKDPWIRDLQAKDYSAASDDEREVSKVYLGARGKDLRELTGPTRAASAAPQPMRLSGAIAPVNAPPSPGLPPEQ